jgi:hypothetical protein
MPTFGRVESKIRRIEGFLVSIQDPERRDVRSDRQGLPSWPYERAAKDSWTVARWKRERFKALYPGFEVDVLDVRHHPLRGQTRLGTVRGTYKS